MEKLVPGLEGVPIMESQVGFIDGQKGILEYRGIPIEVLAEKSSYEEVAYLLLWGELPTREEMAKFDRDLRTHRRVKYRIIDLMKCLPENGHPMDALQAAVAALGMFYPAKLDAAGVPPGTNILTMEQHYWSIIRLIAKLPTIVAAFERMRHGDEPVRPRDDLSHAANFLWMLTEEEPDPLDVHILDVCLMLHAEHTMNASTFSGLVVGSTLADPYTMVSSAIGALTGPLHGGANEQALRMFREIKTVDRVRPYITGKLERKEKIMGVGHRVYKVKDPRATTLQDLARHLFQVKGEHPLYKVAQEVEQVINEHVGAKGIASNVDFYSGVVYDTLGIHIDQFTPIFAIARVAGWLAHWVEELRNNRIFRPDQIYTGMHDLPYASIEQRQ
ncbi:MAG: citrate synthase [Deltaproteobacteria bacterium]|nr:citrate synthase [Deltaproteobacteria bacterium]